MGYNIINLTMWSWEKKQELSRVPTEMNLTVLCEGGKTGLREHN